METKDLRILGYFTTPFKRQTYVPGSYRDTCSHEFTDEPGFKYTFVLIDNKLNYYHLKMYTYDHMCGSGYCSSTTGRISIEQVNPHEHNTNLVGVQSKYYNFARALQINLTILNNDLIDAIGEYDHGNIEGRYKLVCDQFEFSNCNGDTYYPNGFLNINFEYFDKPDKYLVNEILDDISENNNLTFYGQLAIRAIEK